MPLKQRKVEDDAESSSSSDEGSDQDMEETGYTGNEEIQVDFEGRNPTDGDFHGIRQLLQQLFLKAHINLSELADIIIGQNYVGSVLTQSQDDSIDEDEDDDMVDSNIVFGITTAVNLTAHGNLSCIQQLKTFIQERAEQNTTDDVLKMVKKVLNDQNNSVGLLLNERYINLPPQIAVPCLESLCQEVKRARDKGKPFNFTYYFMMVKLYKREEKGKVAEELYTNGEEELFCKEAVCSFEYSVQSESDTGLSGKWMEDDKNLIPYRRLLVLDAGKLPNLIMNVKSFIDG